jgi:hypothetical protein
MPNISQLVAALMASEKQDTAMRALLQGGWGYDNNRGASLLSGGGRATLDIPLTDRLTVSPYFGGGGAFGKVPTPKGDMKIKKFDPEFGVGLNYKFD